MLSFEDMAFTLNDQGYNDTQISSSLGVRRDYFNRVKNGKVPTPVGLHERLHTLYTEHTTSPISPLRTQKQYSSAPAQPKAPRVPRAKKSPVQSDESDLTQVAGGLLLLLVGTLVGGGIKLVARAIKH